jgi:metal-responsive CopG/Arc/MetJ family transcriptional regulator
MIGMTERSKVKVSLSLPAELVDRVDCEVKNRPGSSRSAVVEEWLRQGARLKAEGDLRSAVVAYYRDLDPAEQIEEAALARSLSCVARNLRVDDPHTKPAGRKKR